MAGRVETAGHGTRAVRPDVGRPRPSGHSRRGALRSPAPRVPPSIASREPEPGRSGRLAARASFDCARTGQPYRTIDFTNPVAAHPPECDVQCPHLSPRTTWRLATGIGPYPDGLVRVWYDHRRGVVGCGRENRL